MKRILIKSSGEALAGEKGTGYDFAFVTSVCESVKKCLALGAEVGIVIGGGNFWRGRSSENINRCKADQIGMLATVMNCLYVSEVFRSEGMTTEIITPFIIGAMTTLFSKDAANAAFNSGKVCFFAGGTGHPYFSTDTGIVLRAIEMDADQVLLAKNIDGVYEADPRTHPEAKRYDVVSIRELVEKRLDVIDHTASVMCEDNHMPFAIFDLRVENSIEKALNGTIAGTIVTA